MIMTFARIASNPGRTNGQPGIRNHRLAVRQSVEGVTAYRNREDLRREYLELEDKDIDELLACATARLDD
jgi:uncharacterized protein (DUF433 family)